ncbi:MAG: hypothetical protein EXS38_07140, partial [Opitutus sp.]|nr:hypothetical protein [Opitutus sp.]
MDPDIRVDGEQMVRWRKRHMKAPTIVGADREVRAHDETYKRNAVEISQRGDRTIKQVAEELGVSSWVLYRWRKLYVPAVKGAGPTPQTMEAKDAEIR